MAQSQASPQSASAALPTWTKLAVDAPPLFENMRDRSLGVDPIFGSACIAYGGDKLYFSCQNPITNLWTHLVIDDSAQVGEYTALAFNMEGWPFITYYDAYYAQLKLAYKSGNVWSAAGWTIVVVPDVIDPTPETLAALPDAPALAADGGMIAPPAASVKSVPNGAKDLRVVPSVDAPADPDAVTPAATDTPAATAAPAATDIPAATAAPETAAPQATAPETTAPEATIAAPEAVTAQETPTPQLPGDEPTVEQRIHEALQPWLGNQDKDPSFNFYGPPGYGKYSSIDIDRRDGVHISYYDAIDGSLEYIYWDGLNWWGAILDDYADQNTVGQWSSIVVDYYYNVYIAYMSEKYDDLKFAFHRASDPPNSRWTTTTVDGSETRINRGSFASIALEQDLTGDNEKSFAPHISYYDFTNDQLRHAWRRYNSGSNTYTWVTETVDTGGTGGNVGWYSSIAVDADDVVHISYFDAKRGDLRWARKSGGKWTITSLDASESSMAGMFTSMAIDLANRPIISYLRASTGTLRFLRRVKNTGDMDKQWVGYDVVAMGHDVGLSTSLAVDKYGMAHVSYFDATTGTLRYTHSAPGQWPVSTLGATTYSGAYSSIDTDDAFPRIVYNEQQDQEAMYAAFGSWGWAYLPVDTTYKFGQYVSLELDKRGMPHASYYDATHKELIYAENTLNTTRWFTQTVDIDGVDVGWYSSLALDQNDRPFISYYDASLGQLKVISRSPINTWVPQMVDWIGKLELEGVGLYSSIDIDGQGRPHVSYYDITNKQLKYAWWNNTNPSLPFWDISILDDSSADVGRFSSLVIDTTTNTRHVCYYDYANGNLKYAQWDGTTNGPWQFQVVDGSLDDGDAIDEGDVGLYCSIDLSPAGQPVISYYDNSHGDLKVATSYPFPIGVSGRGLYLPSIYR